MAVDKETVAKIAHLSRIRVADERLAPMTDELNNILKWIEQLDEVETDGVPPMTSAVETKLQWRDDEVTDGDKAADVLKNAPNTEYGFYAVPKVIE
jgi:aspartyl-tRNA(Asn)/glutamyl-tRNA(Gln) amidotransferase subunit C